METVNYGQGIAKGDLTGRDRMVSNVLYSWGGYLVFVITGFIMPRMIDGYVGQTALGIWDFCWSLVSYLSLAGLGVGSSVNRYVAKYRAENDVLRLRQAVSSVMGIQVTIALFIQVGTAVLAWGLPRFFVNRLGTEIGAAQWVVFFLGSSLALEMAFDATKGVITGCHRWDLHNFIHAGSRIISVSGMIIALLLGGGLRSLSLVYFFTIVGTEITRVITAFLVCRELRIGLKYAEWGRAKEMLLFGIKTIVAGLPPFVVVTTSNVLIAGYLGPAALAVFARPVMLVRHVETFVNKLAFVMTPTTGSLQGKGRQEDVRRLLIQSTCFGIALTLPIVIILTIFGDVILHLWMGPKYAVGTVLTILSLGYLLPVCQSPVLRILMGLNLHGRIGLISSITSLLTFALGILLLKPIGWSLVSGSLLVAISLTVGGGILVPILACKRLGIAMKSYVRESFLVPVLCNAAFAVCLVLVRLVFDGYPVTAFVTGVGSGSLLLTILYWLYLVPAEKRRAFHEWILTKLGRKQPYQRESVS